MNSVEQMMDRRSSSGARGLRDTFSGPVYLPGEDGYEAARLPWRRNIDPHPTIVAEASRAEDVRAALLTARQHDLPFAVQSTGHGVVLPADGGLLVKTSRMNAVYVDPEWRTARVGPGALWSDVIAAAAPFGLAPLSGTPSVGVAGYTLGGGTGWLSRTYGFAADSLLLAEVVTAEGEVLTASAGEHLDLFWAIRGGSGNFGVVTELTCRLYPVDRVYAGVSLYAIDRAAETFARYRDWAIEEPDELSTAIMLLQMPPAPHLPEPVRGKRVLAIRVFSLAQAEASERRLAPRLAAAGPPLLSGFGTMTFAEAGMAIAGPPSPPMAARQHLDLFREVSDDLIDTLIEAAGDGSDSPLAAIELRYWGGAMARPAADAGPVGHRDVPFSVTAAAMFDGSRERDGIDAYVDRLAARLRPHATGGSFLNFLSDPTRTETAYAAEDYRRLVALKQIYDLDNVFHLNHNIPPRPEPNRSPSII
ncbi:MAG: FAD-binding oxidoreductase [Thermomicrobiales bacterium]